MGRSKEMPLAVAEHLARVVKPLREAIGPQTVAATRWGISQSHLSQIEQGAGCGVSVLLTLREKLGLSLEELCFPPGKRKEAAPARPALDLDAIRDVVRSELEARSEPPPSEPTEPPGPLPKKGHSDAPRHRRR